MNAVDAPPLEATYNHYAAVYDRSGQIRFSLLMDMYLVEILEQHPVPGRRMLDLACGTGTLALMQAGRGWHVIGLDRSEAMRAEARRKQQAAGVDVVFQAGDMRAFALEEPVDLVTCCYDSLNYLLVEDELLACLRSVQRALAPCGLFCFDLATEFFLRNYWQGTEEYTADGYHLVMESSFDEISRLSTLLLSGTLAPETGFHEVHVERAYAPPVVERLLRQAGLVPEALYDCFTLGEPNEKSLRHFWVARKPAGVGTAGEPEIH